MRSRFLLPAFILAVLFCTVRGSGINDLAAVPGQSNSLEVKTFVLPNGLTVYLNEDDSKPEIFGGVVVRAGSRNDPDDATGLAHYFEHIMFKGTDKIGTINWEAEKVYLDSISLMYDRLAESTDPANRNAILRDINRLSIRAAEYAIPNETDVLLRDIGGSDINAGTGHDLTVYYNSFPSHQLDRWMEIYYERFRNPVFRLFQSELEVVYEEKNLYSDTPVQGMLEDFLKTHYKEHPYSRPIIGFTEHLQNPRISRMMEFFDTWYVANNMALVLIGDFRAEEIMPMIEEKFGQWRSGEVPALPETNLPAYNGREFREVRMSPVRIGLMGFRTVESTHPDSPVFELASRILSNSSGTGIFDKMMLENKVLAIQPIPLQSYDHGTYIILFVPKIVGQRFGSAEALVEEGLQKLRNGEFSDELLQAIKLEYRKEKQRSLETADSRGNLIINAFISGRTWEDVLGEIDEADRVSREDIMRVAARYLGQDRLVYLSKMGNPRKDRLVKPDWEPVLPMNTEAKSAFARMIDEMPDLPSEPRFVTFGQDVLFTGTEQGKTFYHTHNPYNDIFTLRIQFHKGRLHNQKLDDVATFVNLIGTEESSFQEFKSKLQNLGASVDFSVSDNFFVVNVEGFDDQFVSTLALVNEILHQPRADESQIRRIAQAIQTNHRFRKRDPMEIGNALYEYALYGDNSSHMRNTTRSEARKYSGGELLTLFRDVIRHEATIVYTGSISFDESLDAISRSIQWESSPMKVEYIELQRREHQENTIFVNHNKKARQSNINFYVQGFTIPDEKAKAHSIAFNEYFGAGMSSIVFQEIREFRSLSYAAVANYQLPILSLNPGHLRGYMNTQSDKTVEGIQAMSELFMDMPLRPERMDGIRKGLSQSVYTSRPGFREMGAAMASWRRQGYEQDPSSLRYPIFREIEFDDITDFYTSQLKGKPIIISVTGNMKDVDRKQLESFGKIVDLKYKNFVRE